MRKQKREVGLCTDNILNTKVYYERKNFIKYYLTNEYAVGICRDGTEFIFDLELYEKVSAYNWYFHKGAIIGRINGKEISLVKFMFDFKKRVRRKDHTKNDYRKENLYFGNVYVDKGDYFEVECFDGECFLIDKDDYPMVNPYPWEVDKGGYVISTTPDRRTIKLHRLILGVLDNKSCEIDHINRNTTDNRRANLRIVSRSQNCLNRGLMKSNKSGYKGVYWHTAGKAWAAQYKKDKKTYYLGLYPTKELAVAALTAAKIQQ